MLLRSGNWKLRLGPASMSCKKPMGKLHLAGSTAFKVDLPEEGARSQLRLARTPETIHSAQELLAEDCRISVPDLANWI